jgi:hypothetical protein
VYKTIYLSFTLGWIAAGGTTCHTPVLVNKGNAN